jgi:hypothetical protein
MTNIQAVVNEFRSFMRKSSYSLQIPNDWLTQCAEFIVQQYPVFNFFILIIFTCLNPLISTLKNKSVRDYVDTVYKQLLDYDLAAIGATGLPENTSSMSSGFLEGTHFLQVRFTFAKKTLRKLKRIY